MYLWTSEFVSKGHPDKVADQIADAVLDAYLAGDPESRVACEVTITKDLVLVTGEVNSQVSGTKPASGWRLSWRLRCLLSWNVRRERSDGTKTERGAAALLAWRAGTTAGERTVGGGVLPSARGVAGRVLWLEALTGGRDLGQVNRGVLRAVAAGADRAATRSGVRTPTPQRSAGDSPRQL